MIVILIATNLDFGAMKKYELRHQSEAKEAVAPVEQEQQRRGKVLDLIVPIAVLIVLCISAMLYTGGILDGASVKDAFANCDSSLSLVLGSFFTLIVTFLLYLPRKIVTYKEFTDSIIEGFKAMVPAITILSLAWTLSGVCSADYLNAGGFVRELVMDSQIAHGVLPAIFFVTALGLAFATGTSWEPLAF